MRLSNSQEYSRPRRIKRQLLSTFPKGCLMLAFQIEQLVHVAKRLVERQRFNSDNMSGRGTSLVEE